MDPKITTLLIRVFTLTTGHDREPVHPPLVITPHFPIFKAADFQDRSLSKIGAYLDVERFSSTDLEAVFSVVCLKGEQTCSHNRKQSCNKEEWIRLFLRFCFLLD